MARPTRRNTGGGLAALLGGTAALLLLAGYYLWLLGGTAPGGTQPGGAWTLTRGDGQVVSDRDYRGRYLLIYFGYTACPDMCPTTLGEMADAMSRLGPAAARVQPLFVTLDPARDTPAVVRDYVAAFGADIIGLTGTQAQLDQIAQQYRIHHAVHRTGPGSRDYTVDHSSVLYLVGPRGRLLVPIRADEAGPAMAADIARHIP